MAGQIPLLIETSGRNHSVPDHFETFTKTFDNGASTDNDGALFYAERDTIIDSAFAVCNDTDGDSDLTFTIKQAPSGTAIGSATAVSSAMAVTEANVVATGTIDVTNNLVPAGSVVFVDVGGTSDAGSFVSLVQVRTRTRV